MINEIHFHNSKALRPAVPAIVEVLDVSESTARRLIKSGVVRCLRAGNQLRVTCGELDRIRAVGAPAGRWTQSGK